MTGNRSGGSRGEPVDWRSGLPRSERYGDVYHSASGALAQARHVFLAGCGLPQAWAGRQSWTVLETGFGLATNFLATWLAWRRDPERPQTLCFVTFEAHLVSPDDIRRAAAATPAFRELADALADHLVGLVADPLVAPVADSLVDPVADHPVDPVAYHPVGPVADPLPAVIDGSPAAGAALRRLRFESGRVELRIHEGDAAAVLATLGGGSARPAVDSVFLDGFSPARNPAIWSDAVFAAIAALLNPGARLATWTVAGTVRRTLVRHGFTVAWRPGLPPKRECLVAWRESPDITDRSTSGEDNETGSRPSSAPSTIDGRGCE
ncbi:MAG: MnmC family methyltransferase [Burkholderiaceae bacterium]